MGSSPAKTWDTIKVAGQIRRWDRKISLILITRHGSEARVIAAAKAGATKDDYLKVPF